MESLWTPMVEVIPPGEIGNVKIAHVVVSDHDAMLAALRRERLSVGPIAQLLINGCLMMSDGDNEKITNTDAVIFANGDVLVAGLGLGMILVPMLQNPEVRSVLVLEKYPSVISLVEHYLRQYVGDLHKKLTVLEADVFDWEPPKDQKWDCIYFDIWPNICVDNLNEITKLKRRYTRRLIRDNPKSWMKAWEEGHLRSRKRRDARRERMWLW